MYALDCCCHEYAGYVLKYFPFLLKLNDFCSEEVHFTVCLMRRCLLVAYSEGMFLFDLPNFVEANFCQSGLNSDWHHDKD